MFKYLSLSALFAAIGFSAISFADDTELYVFESTARSGSKPQVLIIFDTSGSMGTNFNTDVPYERGDENLNDNGNLRNATKLFFSRSSSDVPLSSSLQYFKHKINGCQISENYLEDYGMFTGFLREHKYVGENGVWSELPLTDGSGIQQVDCYEDIAESNFKNNGVTKGFPVDGLGTSAEPIRYTNVDGNSSAAEVEDAITKAKLTNLGIGQSITLYTEKYVNWYHSTKSTQNYSRMAVAKRVMEDTIVTTPGVDFGLSVFNENRDDDDSGGRIIYDISPNNVDNKDNLLEAIDDLGADGWTPLCENLYEAYRYFSGKSVYFGDDDSVSTPSRDKGSETSETSGIYESPFEGKQCQDKAYVIYVTDGEPTRDTDANSVVEALGITSSEKYESNYLPALAGWLHTNDVNTTLEGTQTISTYTIGFSSGAASAAPILQETANRGGGDYYSALDAQKLQEALQNIFSNILESNSSFTSPSVASNNFDRTQTLDSVYYAMFLPNKGPRWLGNLKKFKVTGSGDVVDKNGNNAIGDDGNLDSSACSYWTPASVCSATSGGGDGNDVAIGGASLMLQSADRTLYGNFGSGGALTDFTKSNAINSAGIGSEDELALFMGVDKSELQELFDWAEGKDVDDEDLDNSTSDMRTDVMGDPLHSKPLAINYGTDGSPDVRVLLGTNQGFVHMFKDKGDEVEETWAFMPQELLPNLRELRANVPTGVHSVYGMDSPPVAYVQRSASGAIEKAWLFIGMRRGGKSYYALNITNPDSPTFMWKIDASSTGMADIGQTWSEPVVTFVPGVPAGNTASATASPVLIIGGGYNPSTKDAAGVGDDDTIGRGVYIVNAETGSLVHHFGTSGGTSKTSLPGIIDSIPNSVAILDSNNDKLTDRIYATDTGANIWRMDLPSASPNDTTNPWTAFKFASLGDSSQEGDRRFFAEAAVAQTVFTNISEVTVTVDGESTTTTSYQNVPYDAVTVGSGHRPHPLDKTRSDKFFVLQDRNIVTKSFTGTAGSEIPETLEIEGLYDVTSTPPESEDENIAFGVKRGWYYSFSASGEKSLSAPSIIQGKVFFTSYVPGNLEATNQCLVTGEGRLYGFDLHKGTRSYSQEYLEMGDRVPDTPQLVIPPNGDGDSYMYLIGIGSAGDEMEKVEPIDDGCPPGDEKCIGGGLGINKIYYHIDE
ncbi:pilus assembly protein [Shewanella sp. 6_MG-2023]|uniref:pilus assembly protein n=1 Tax=Shewanella sp. 6_MG-2023 TaxID=3062660 RepID=UPI0026E1C878|nr:PilC/PilY family type IV pilus protein [Shewanella sp. 6_MG-2023]MDO6617544.1 PilC/PilY family type IV pilus protein [Shewanella sp. 6_MG-2023]